MPTISFNYEDFENLLGQKLPFEKMRDLALMHAKAEVDEYDEQTGQIKISLDDTNLPYLWSVEGLARLFRGVLEIETGLPELKIHKSDFKILVDAGVKKCRPFISSFVAEGREIDDNLLEQIIQLQEKFCEGYGRKREKVSIGLYSHKKIKFPVHYKAVKPDSVSFAPLETKEKMNLKEVLEKNPKGIQYGHIISKLEKYPLLMDSQGEVLSLVPIINSDFTGKLVPGDSEMLFEATGTDEDAVNLAANVFAQNLSERGFKISEVSIADGSKEFATPKGFEEEIKINEEDVEKLIGLKLSFSEIKQLLEKGRYGVSRHSVKIPDFRRDILHLFDVVEDVAIIYGFDKIESKSLENYTTGEPDEMSLLADSAREIAISSGFQEILSPVLSNKKNMQEKMELPESSDIVEIENVMSDTYSAVRNWLIPVLLEVLSKNKHSEFPQKIFEEGVVNVREDDGIIQKERIAFAISHGKADFTDAKQALDVFMSSLGLPYSIKKNSDASFIKGRSGDVFAGGKKVGIIGEISPSVLSRWELENPVGTVELDLTVIKELI